MRVLFLYLKILLKTETIICTKIEVIHPIEGSKTRTVKPQMEVLLLVVAYHHQTALSMISICKRAYETSKINSRHKSLNNYLENSIITDKIKDGIYKFFSWVVLIMLKVLKTIWKTIYKKIVMFMEETNKLEDTDENI